MRDLASQTRRYSEFGLNLRDFLHEVAFQKEKKLSLEPMFAEEPPRLEGLFPEGIICDAYLAATADYLSRINHLSTPSWALDERRVLAQPWFALEYESLRSELLRDTPSAFKDKNIFTFASALNVA